MASRTAFLRSLLAITLFTACLQGSVGIDLSLRFIKEPEDVIVKRNQPVVLDCSASSGPEYGPVNVTWYHNDVLVNDARRQILTNGSLYIRRVRFRKHAGSGSSSSSGGGSATSGNGETSDMGKYHCTIATKLGTLRSRLAHLYITSMSKKFSQEPMSEKAEEGDVVQFRCQIQASPLPTYSWQRNPNTSQGSTSWVGISQVENRFTILPAGVLQIDGVLLSDAGRYRCIAQVADHEQKSMEATLEVILGTQIYRPPTFLMPDATVTFNVGTTAVLECLASGYPKPLISWARLDGKAIRNNLSGQGNLVIEPLTTEDSAMYICTAANKNPDTMESKSIAQSVQLNVHSPPSFSKTPFSIRGPLGKTARFECMVQGIPAPVVKWFKDGRVMESSNRIKHKNIITNELVILQTISADSGIYQCVATNSAGYGSASARLQVMTSLNQPDPPTDLYAITMSNTSIELHWNAAVSRNNLSITAYTVHCYRASGGEQEIQKVSVNASYLFDKLKPYTNYTFYVRAFNTRSASEPSESITWITGEDVPLAAPFVTLSSSMTSLHVFWEELPPNLARGIIVKYKIQWKKQDHSSMDIRELPNSVREYTITGLRPGKKYHVRVLAATKMGYSKLDDRWPWITHELPDHIATHVPSAPELHLNTINTTAIRVEWGLPKGNSFEAAGYNLSYQKQNHKIWVSVILPGNNSHYIIVDLEPHTFYDVRIFGFNENGNGQESIGTKSTFQNSLVDQPYDDSGIISVVEPPTQLEAHSIQPRAIHLKWKSPLTIKNISYFTIRYNPVHNSSILNSSMVTYIRSYSQEALIADLMPYTQYEFSVRSHVHEAVHGPYSNKVECKTLEDVPTAPRRLDWRPLDDHTVRIFWQPPQYPNGIITGYQILYNTEPEHQQLDKWYTIKQQASEFSSIVNDLDSNTRYYLCMRAETRAGAGPPTEVLTISIPSIPIKNVSVIPPGIDVEFQDPRVGIIVGVSIGVCCMIICALIIACRNRCFPPPIDHRSLHLHRWSNGYAPHVNGNGQIPQEYRISSSESHEMDSITPMLTHLPDTISSHLDTKGGYAISLPYVNGRVEHNGGPNTRYNNDHVGPRQQSLINITENPQFEMSNDLLQGDASKRKSQQMLRGSPSSSSAPLLDGSSEQTSGSSEGNPSGTVAPPLLKGNHNAREQPVVNGHSQGNGLNVQQHHHNRNSNHHHKHHPHKHNHQPLAHGVKRSKRHSTGASTQNGSTYPQDVNAASSSASLTPLHSSTPKAETQPKQVLSTGTAAVVTIPPNSSGRASKDGRRRRPLSHTAISATPNNVGSSYSTSLPLVMTSANLGGNEQRLSTSPKSGRHNNGDNASRQNYPSWQPESNQQSQSSSSPSSTSPTSSSSSASSSSQPNANSHKSLAPT